MPPPTITTSRGPVLKLAVSFGKSFGSRALEQTLRQRPLNQASNRSSKAVSPWALSLPKARASAAVLRP